MDYKARFYSPTLGGFTQPDTVVPEPSSSQAWNRYSYAVNNPIKYNDPTGHEAEDEGEECTDSAECDLEGGNNEGKPLIFDIDGKVIIIIMPPGSDPAVQRPEWAVEYGEYLHVLGWAADWAELGLLLEPMPGTEDAVAGIDVGLTALASYGVGETYFFDKPHPDVPSMIGINQDVLVTGADFGIALGAKVTGAVTSGLIGYETGWLTDAVTTVASIAYDTERTITGDMPNYVTIGVSMNLDKSFGEPIIMVWPQ